jgi:pimeloyl-ACP methyl ester carboxylesterase
VTTTATPATPWREVPAFFPAEDSDLFGIVTLPGARPKDVGVLLAWGGGPYPSCGRNGVRTRLARRLAGRGLPVVRFDYQGVGESSGRARPVRFDEPWAADVFAASRQLAAQGVDRIVLLGNCFGGRNVLASASRIDRLAGVALIGSPVLDMDHTEMLARRQSLGWHTKRALSAKTVRNLARPKTRRRYARILATKVRSMIRRLGHLPGSERASAQTAASPGFLAPIRSLVSRGVPLLFAYSTADPAWLDFCRARDGELGRVLAPAGNLVTIRPIEASVRDLQTEVALQSRVIEEVEDWLETIVPRAAAPPISDREGD